MERLNRIVAVLFAAFVSGIIVFGGTSYPAGVLPNPKLTPGAINPAVTQANIQQTICKSGWTATIRPASYFTTGLKKEQIVQYRYKDTNPSNYEEDHLISLQLGGSPDDEKNLWPQSYKTTPNARDKDQVENYLKREVCAGRMTLKEAQKAIRSNWTKVKVVKSFGAVEVGDPDDEN